VETTANANGVILRAEEHAQDPRKAFDPALKNLERQIKRHNESLKSKGHFHVPGETAFILSDDGGEAVDWTTYDPVIEKVKRVPLHPMTAKEAVMQMELVGHNFFVFQNGDTGDVNVVYKRNDGNYGQLEPVK
jgi:putative sigma-54 modulation protein